MPPARLRRLARLGLVLAMLATLRALRQEPTARRHLDAFWAAAQGHVVALADQLREGGAEGIALYALVYVAGSLLALPLWLMSGIAGYAWGFGRGLATAVPALVLGATCAFHVGRAVAKTRLGDALRARPMFRQVDLVVRRDGRRITTLLRASPVMPQNFLHFVLGATPLPTRDFAFATAVGLFPMTCVHVYGGSLLHSASDLFAEGRGLRDPATLAKLALGLAVTGVMLFLVMRRARALLAQAYAEADAAKA
jgi:uncharacterized membrane protein YdjX (TVP38/TMEM64 family)